MESRRYKKYCSLSIQNDSNIYLTVKPFTDGCSGGKCASASVNSIPLSKCLETTSPSLKCHAPSISRFVQFITRIKTISFRSSDY